MILHKKYLLPSVLTILAACTQETLPEANTPEQRIPLNISGSITQTATKANADGFVDQDALGLYAVNYGENNTVAGDLLASGNQADNAKYVFDEANYKWTPVKPVYYKDVNTHVDLYAYYPYLSGISDVNACPFEVKADQTTAATASSLSGYEASDFLWGKTEDVTPTESNVAITLKHRMAAVQVTLVEGSGFGSGEFAALSKSLLLMGTTRKATIDFSSGTVTPVGDAQPDGIVMTLQEDGSFRAIAVPQTVTAGTRLFSITVDGITYAFRQAEAIGYLSGKQTNIAITINKKTPAGDYEFTLTDTQIVDWVEDGNTHGGEARQYYVVNVTTAGTLGELIAAAGKNPDKIRNLKVTGNVDARDFYFMRDHMAILEAVNMKEATVVAGENHAANVIPDNAFSGKSSLYYYVFPETITVIGNKAFSESGLSGALIIPDKVIIIGESAFHNTNIGSISFSPVLETILGGAFSHCSSLTGTLSFPATLKEIQGSAFSTCGGLSGPLSLPESLTALGDAAFFGAGKHTGDLIIPSGVTKIPTRCFYGTKFSGRLFLNGAQDIGNEAFENCGLSGELVLSEGMVFVNSRSFYANNFSSIVFPSTLKQIGQSAFEYNYRLTGDLIIPDSVIIIESSAFHDCSLISKVELPSSLQTIGAIAFNNCYGITSLISHSTTPPTVLSNAFDGIAKDNFTVEVPEQSVIQYQTADGWSDFRRIAAHHDFSISRRYSKALNAEVSKTYTLRCPSGANWSIESKPDWISVTPSSGTGKTEVTVTFAQMARTNDSFTHEVGFYGQASATEYKGRSGEIVFLLDGKNYRSTLTVEQYDYDYGDGDVVTLQSKSQGDGVNIVIMGDCYDAADIASGTYLTDMTDAYGWFFHVEPYKSYKDYFNVYAVLGMSDDSGIGTVNTIKDAKFGSQYSLQQSGGVQPDESVVFEYATKPGSHIDVSKTLVILMENTTSYDGITYMWGDGSAISVCTKSAEAYPYDFRGIVQHEAGGHGFGKLADEYIYTNAFISSCICKYKHLDDFNSFKSIGWYRNLESTGDMNEVSWSHLIFHPSYSNVVDIYEGGFFHTRGIYRSEPTSCMNNNIPYFSAISRQAIVERIKEYAGETFTLTDFYAHDSFDVGAKTKAGDTGWSTAPSYVTRQSHEPVFMGDSPKFNRSK